tara:strand:- start:966 stop:1376 length:411 start_codon:yes stop_codon:yes gene_type:complete
MGFDRTRKDLGIDAIRFTADALNELYGDPQVNITFNEFNEFDYSAIDLQNYTLCSEEDLKTKIEEVYNKWVSNQYQRNRVGIGSTGRISTNVYPAISDQLDQLYHDIEAGKFGDNAKTGDWYVGITSVKNQYPKSS